MIMSAEQATEIALAINLVIKLAAQDQSSILEVIADYFTLPSLMMSPPPPPKFVEDNFDEVDDYDGDSSRIHWQASMRIGLTSWMKVTIEMMGVMMGMGVMRIIVGNVMREAILWF